jgi:heptosyltransferase-2
MLIHTDCRHYKGSMPCTFHKADGRPCEGCLDYAPVTTRILVVKLAAVGDVLRTTSILPALRQKYPGSEITWVTKRNAAPLLAGNPGIDRLLLVEENYLEFLRNESFTVGICLDADTLSATILSVADCAERFGFTANRAGKVTPVNALANEWWLMGVNDALKRQNRKTYHEIMYEICDLPLPVHKPSLVVDKRAAGFGEEFFRQNSPRKFSKLVGINTGGGGRWQYKKWTTEGYLGFIELMTRNHPDVGLVLLGGPEEVELNRHIAETSPTPLIDAGTGNSLQEFASIVGALDILLTSDSLAMHIGISLGKPTVVLVGPTSPWELDVFGRGDILHSGIECLSCYLSRCDKIVTCMNTLPPETVVAHVEKYL